MKLDGPPNVDPMFQNDVDARIATVLQRVFMMGVLVGKGQVEDDMNAMSMPLNQAVAGLLQELGKLVPNVSTASQMYHPVIAKTEQMITLPLEKKEPLDRSKQYEKLTPNFKKLESQHNAVVQDMLDSMESEKKKVLSEIATEVNRFKPKSK